MGAVYDTRLPTTPFDLAIGPTEKCLFVKVQEE